jgi:hypothetical protein
MEAILYPEGVWAAFVDRWARGTTMTIGINGMAHVILTVSRFEVAREFYRKLLPELGMSVRR